MSEQDSTTTEEAPEAAEDTTTDDVSAAEQEQQDDDAQVEDWRKDFDPDKAAERIRKLQSEAKNLRTRAKQAEEKAAGADEKEQRIKALEAGLLRERVGRRLNLPDVLVERLRGDTEDELLADAEQLVALVTAPKATTTRKPAEALRGGGQPDKEPEETDLRKLAERMFSR